MKVHAGDYGIEFRRGRYMYQSIAVLAAAAGAGTAASFAFTGAAARETGVMVAALVVLLAYAAWRLRVALAQRGIGSPVEDGDEVLFEIRRTDAP